MVRPGTLNRYVSLAQAPVTTDDSDGFFEPLFPASAWCRIQPIEFSAGGDSTRIVASRVTMRFHPQVTVDTRILYRDLVLKKDRQLFVKSVQNVDDGNHTLVLYCEETV